MLDEFGFLQDRQVQPAAANPVCLGARGYLHIGHTKSVGLKFDIAGQYGGACILPMEDTDPVRESEKKAKTMGVPAFWKPIQVRRNTGKTWLS